MLPQDGKARPPKELALDGFYPIDLAFHWSLTEGTFESGGDSSIVTAYSPREPYQLRNGAVFCFA